jgi:NAD+ synthase (glutamine-hydrolysing)
MTVLIAAAQLNQTVGDFEGNARRIIEAAGKAAAQAARVLLTPELSLSGYPPEDLLLRAAFYDRCQEGLAQILAQCAGLDLHVVVGAPLMREGVRRNAALVLHRGAIVGEYFKRELPNYDVFDEQRYFESGGEPLVFEVDGLRLGVVVCEDFWFAPAPAAAKAAGAQALALTPAVYYEQTASSARRSARNVCSMACRCWRPIWSVAKTNSSSTACRSPVGLASGRTSTRLRRRSPAGRVEATPQARRRARTP